MPFLWPSANPPPLRSQAETSINHIGQSVAMLTCSKSKAVLHASWLQSCCRLKLAAAVVCIWLKRLLSALPALACSVQPMYIEVADHLIHASMLQTEKPSGS